MTNSGVERALLTSAGAKGESGTGQKDPFLWAQPNIATLEMQSIISLGNRMGVLMIFWVPSNLIGGHRLFIIDVVLVVDVVSVLDFFAGISHNVDGKVVGGW